MKVTRTFFILISCAASILIAANLARLIENNNSNTPQKHKARNNGNTLHTRYVIGSDQYGNTLYKEYSAIPPARQLFPNWLAADSLYERGTPEWERIALHPAMLIDEWELELQQTQRLADEP